MRLFFSASSLAFALSLQLASPGLYADEFSANHVIQVGAARVSYYKTGQGPALVLFHGFPLNGQTWRKVIPELASSFTCYAFDVIGFGNSDSGDEAEFSSQGQASVFRRALETLNIQSFALMGNDSGGWIARELALLDPLKVTRLILTDTEIPGHRPPWIPQYQDLAQAPFAYLLFEGLLSSDLWRRSTLGFGGAFRNRDLVDGEFFNLFLQPLLESQTRISNALKFLRNMDFERVDGFAASTRGLTMPVLLLWGDADPVFPVTEAREMISQYPDATLETIPNGKLFVQEEFPDAVANRSLKFLTQ